MSPWLRRALFAPIVVAAAVLALEGIARLLMREGALASIPADSVRAHVTLGGDIVYDPILGWKRSALPNPGLGLDSNGFRHAEVSRAKRPGVIRGFALGDSQTYGAGVEPHEAWPQVAENLLVERGYPVEVINAGLSGYHSRQALRLLETQLLDFDPDFVVVDCQEADDVRDERPSQGASLRPTIERTLFYSRLYRGLRIGVEQASARLHPGSRRNLTLPRFALPSPLPRTPTPGNHDLIADLGKSRGIEVFFLDYPFATTPPSPLFHSRSLPRDSTLVSTVPSLLATGLPVDALFLDNNHLTAKGNRVVGERLADALQAWIDADRR